MFKLNLREVYDPFLQLPYKVSITDFKQLEIKVNYDVLLNRK